MCWSPRQTQVQITYGCLRVLHIRGRLEKVVELLLCFLQLRLLLLQLLLLRVLDLELVPAPIAHDRDRPLHGGDLLLDLIDQLHGDFQVRAHGPGAVHGGGLTVWDHTTMDPNI